MKYIDKDALRAGLLVRATTDDHGLTSGKVYEVVDTGEGLGLSAGGVVLPAAPLLDKHYGREAYFGLTPVIEALTGRAGAKDEVCRIVEDEAMADDGTGFIAGSVDETTLGLGEQASTSALSAIERVTLSPEAIAEIRTLHHLGEALESADGAIARGLADIANEVIRQAGGDEAMNARVPDKTWRNALRHAVYEDGAMSAHRFESLLAELLNRKVVGITVTTIDPEGYLAAYSSFVAHRPEVKASDATMLGGAVCGQQDLHLEWLGDFDRRLHELLPSDVELAVAPMVLINQRLAGADAADVAEKQAVLYFHQYNDGALAVAHRHWVLRCADALAERGPEVDRDTRINRAIIALLEAQRQENKSLTAVPDYAPHEAAAAIVADMPNQG